MCKARKKRSKAMPSCLLIGKRFGKLVVKENSLLRGHQRSCGCLQRDVVKETGKSNYDPTIPNERREKTRTLYREQLKIWRASVFARDNYMCTVCFSKKKLNAHHKNGLNKFLDQRFEIDNGVKCCKKCHDDFHNNYGRGDNTEKQWLDWRVSISIRTQQI